MPLWKGFLSLINEDLNRENFFDEVIYFLLKSVKMEKGFLFLYYGDNLSLARGLDVKKRSLQDINKGMRATIDKAILLQEALYDSSFWCGPLLSGEETIGVLYLCSPDKSYPLSLEEREFLQSATQLLGLVMDKSYAYKQFQDKILTKGFKIEVGEECIVGKSKSMNKILREAEKMAQSDANLLLEGETGVGKGLIAQYVHLKSRRRNRPFLTINCSGIPESLFESEFFGYRKGSFTGATRDKEGLVEEAMGGTLFLDEVASIPMSLQAKILELIEKKTFHRVGETVFRRANIRLIFATNENLKSLIETKRFRQDLYFRIETFSIFIPPLRERREDIPLLAHFFLKKYSKEMRKDILGFGSKIMDALLNYSWPGNVRELQNILQKAVALSSGPKIFLEDLDSRIREGKGPSLAEQKRDYERERIMKVLKETGGNITKAAKRLSITRRHLHRLIKKYGI